MPTSTNAPVAVGSAWDNATRLPCTRHDGDSAASLPGGVEAPQGATGGGQLSGLRHVAGILAEDAVMVMLEAAHRYGGNGRSDCAQNQIHEEPADVFRGLFHDGPGWDRTSDRGVMSTLL